MKVFKSFLAVLIAVLLSLSVVSCGKSVNVKSIDAEAEDAVQSGADTGETGDEGSIEGLWTGKYNMNSLVATATSIGMSENADDTTIAVIDMLKNVNSSAVMPLNMLFEDGKLSMYVDVDEFETEAEQYSNDVVDYIFEGGGIWEVFIAASGMTKDEILDTLASQGMTEDEFIAQTKDSGELDGLADSILDGFSDAFDIDEKGNMVLLQPTGYTLEDGKLFLEGDDGYLSVNISGKNLKLDSSDFETDGDIDLEFSLKMFCDVDWAR